MKGCARTCIALSLAVLCSCGSDRPHEELASRHAREPSAAEALTTIEPSSEAPSTDPPTGGPAVEPGRAGPWTMELTLASAPFDEPRAPSVVVHAPPAFDPDAPLRLLVFLHGWSGCARQLVHAGPTPCRDGDPPREGWGLADRVDASGTDALFVVPQLAFLRRDGSPGRFADDGRFSAFLTELLASLRPVLGADASVDDLESISLFAHSAGFETALAILAHGSIDVANVVLFDALYRGVEPFTSWAASSPRRKLVSLYTGGRTERQSRMLAFSARRALGDDAVSLDDDRLAQAIATHRVTIARSPAHHADVPAHHFPELLPALGLSARP